MAIPASFAIQGLRAACRTTRTRVPSERVQPTSPRRVLAIGAASPWQLSEVGARTCQKSHVGRDYLAARFVLSFSACFPVRQSCGVGVPELRPGTRWARDALGTPLHRSL